MPRLPRPVLPLAPAALALALLGPGGAVLARLAADPAAIRLLQAIDAAAVALPLAIALLAARFHQARLTLAAVVLSGLGAAVVLRPLFLEGPGLPATLVCVALALGLGSRLPERGVGSTRGVRAIGLATVLAALPAVLALGWPDDLARALLRLGPAVQPSPGLGVPWIGLGLMAGALAACWKANGRDRDLVGPTLAAVLVTGAIAAWLPPGPALPASVAVLGGASSLLAATLCIAWRRGYVDDLTQLPGRRALDVALDGLWGPHAIAVIDVDHFKRFNDEHGHDAGDDALRIVARVLRSLRGGTAYRQGGEEFVAILPRLGAAEAALVLDELREAIEATPLVVRGRPGERRKALRVTASIGVAASAPGASSRDVLRAADQALLRAKKLGRNRVEPGRVTEPGRSSRSASARRSAGAPRAPRRAASRGR